MHTYSWQIYEIVVKTSLFIGTEYMKYWWKGGDENPMKTKPYILEMKRPWKGHEIQIKTRQWKAHENYDDIRHEKAMKCQRRSAKSDLWSLIRASFLFAADNQKGNLWPTSSDKLPTTFRMAQYDYEWGSYTVLMISSSAFWLFSCPVFWAEICPFLRHLSQHNTSMHVSPADYRWFQ